MFLILLSICIDFINTPLHQDSGIQIYTKKSLAICVLSGQCYLDQKGQSYCSQKGQFFLAKGGKFVWLFHNTLKDILGQSGENDSLGSSIFEGHAYASTRRAVAYDVSARDVCLQQFSTKGFVRLLVPGAMSSKDVLALLIRKGYGMKSLPDCRSVYQISSDSLLRQHLYAVLRTDKKDVSEYDVQNDEFLILKSDSLTELYFKRAEELAQAVHEASVNGSSVISIAAIGDALHQVWLDDVVQPLCKALMLVSDKRQACRLSECFVEQ